MNHRNGLCLLLLALVAVSASPLRAVIVEPPLPPTPVNPPTTTFFQPSTYYGNDSSGDRLYYLEHFGVFTFDQSDPSYLYKLDFGWLYNFGGMTDTSDDVYLYDFETDDVLWTAANLYPYFYSFNEDRFLYYFEGSSPREFYDFTLDSIVTYPLLATLPIELGPL